MTPYFDFQLNEQQQAVFDRFQQFADQVSEEQVFILRGYAGTGKTTMIKGISRFLDDMGATLTLLASTGKAARIISRVSGLEASTVHSLVYKYSGLNQNIDEAEKSRQTFGQDAGQLIKLTFVPRVLNEDWLEHPGKPRFYLIDEASMIGAEKQGANSFADFGSYSLLGSLLNYDPKGKFVFVGDPLQLPPVGSDLSPALEASVFRRVGMEAVQLELTHIMRQALDNGILQASLALRKSILQFRQPGPKWPKLQLKPFARNDIDLHLNQPELLNQYIQSYESDGPLQSTMICGSNALRQELNRNIRKSLGKSTGPEVGDLLLVTQNNYLAPVKNGDLVQILNLGDRLTYPGIRFLQAQLCLIDLPDEPFEALLTESLLDSKYVNLTQEQQQQLIIRFNMRMRDRGIRQKDPAYLEEMRQDPYLNSVRAVYGYAMTCHKAQGGEWPEVYLYMNNSTAGYPKPYVYRWWYTAITRASNRLHVADDWYIR